MRPPRLRLTTCLNSGESLSIMAGATARTQPREFRLEETTIADVHAAMKVGSLTCRQLTQCYLDRISAYDVHGPKLNSIITINANALSSADELDAKFKVSGLGGRVHGIPVILKDNYNTADMPTTGGSISLADSRPPVDTFTVTKLREEGALILAKANLHELALAGTTVSSLGGQTRNPYSLDRTPGGSSGGTAAAIAANFGIIGTGTDTENSIRSPASANSLVGLRPTRGMVSRSGILPVSSTQDAAGPITRSVADAAIVLSVLSGYDSNDPQTAYGIGQTTDYARSVRLGGLQGARLGVVETLFGSQPIHEPVKIVVRAAIDEMRRLGVTLIPIEVLTLDTDRISSELDVQRFEYRRNLNAYLARLGARAPIKTLSDLIARGQVHPSIAEFVKVAQEIEAPLEQVEYKNRILKGLELQQFVLKLMADSELDALVYPHQKRLVVPIGECQMDRNGSLASVTGLPAITVPAGFSTPSAIAPIGVPVGIEFLGRPWSEPILIRLAYAFEQATKHRRPPPSTPPLMKEP